MEEKQMPKTKMKIDPTSWKFLDDRRIVDHTEK